jgi:arginase
LGLDQIVLVGQRDLDPYEADLIRAHGIPHLGVSEDLPTRLRRVIGGRSVYVHFDCDVLQPGIVPTDYVLEGGLTLAQVLACCGVIAEHRFIGIEIAEFQDCWTPGGEAVSPGPLLDAFGALPGLWRRATA